MFLALFKSFNMYFFIFLSPQQRCEVGAIIFK